MKLSPYTKLRKVLLAIIIPWFICSALVFLQGYIQGEWRFDYVVEVKEFTTCSGPVSAIDKTINPITQFPSTTKVIYACGYLRSNIPVHLMFNWYSQADGRLLYHPYDDLKFDTGYFYSEWRPSTLLSAGKYRVDVYFGRTKLASAEFEILNTVK